MAAHAARAKSRKLGRSEVSDGVSDCGGAIAFASFAQNGGDDFWAVALLGRLLRTRERLKSVNKSKSEGADVT
jgi:hypothetical protein